MNRSFLLVALLATALPSVARSECFRLGQEPPDLNNCVDGYILTDSQQECATEPVGAVDPGASPRTVQRGGQDFYVGHEWGCQPVRTGTTTVEHVRGASAPKIDCGRHWVNDARTLGTAMAASDDSRATSDNQRALCQSVTPWRRSFNNQCWRTKGSPYENEQAAPLPLSLDQVDPAVGANHSRQDIYYARYIACACTKLARSGKANPPASGGWNFGADNYGGSWSSQPQEDCSHYNNAFRDPDLGTPAPQAPAAVRRSGGAL
jgi:hypothetical protein